MEDRVDFERATEDFEGIREDLLESQGDAELLQRTREAFSGELPLGRREGGSVSLAFQIRVSEELMREIDLLVESSRKNLSTLKGKTRSQVARELIERGLRDLKKEGQND